MGLMLLGGAGYGDAAGRHAAGAGGRSDRVCRADAAAHGAGRDRRGIQPAARPLPLMQVAACRSPPPGLLL